MAEAEDIVAFWREAGPERWFKRNDSFDGEFRSRFLDDHFAAARRERDGWSGSPEGSLALMVLLDQFPRNGFRDTAHMFATDSLARHFAAIAAEAGHQMALEQALRIFFFLPYMHSEAMEDQDRSVALCSQLDEEMQKYARIHRDIILRFGRFPHRNAAFGRATTAEERSFLDAGGFSG